MATTYMVHFRRNAFLHTDQDKIQREQVRLAELMRENVLQQVYMNKTMENLWMVFRVDSMEILKDIISTLPMCRELYFEISELIE